MYSYCIYNSMSSSTCSHVEHKSPGQFVKPQIRSSTPQSFGFDKPRLDTEVLYL